LIDSLRAGAVCLTADVHNSSSRGWEQRFLPDDEITILAEYLSIAAKYEVPVTVFVSGLAAVQGAPRLRALTARYDVELGGHWFDAFPWRVPYGVWGRLFGRPRGPAWWQRREIRRTVTAIETATGVRIQAWRDHAYRRDRNTYRLLASAGLSAVSDEVARDALRPRLSDGLLSVPINVLPDHENIRHLPPHAGTSFPGSFSAAEWTVLAVKDVDAIVARGGVATILAHPTCMKLSDKFVSFHVLCAALARHPCVRMSELHP
jgi:peptidoglycan/xylan/chitin deacetylase (PgdA/CDA1 family)